MSDEPNDAAPVSLPAPTDPWRQLIERGIDKGLDVKALEGLYALAEKMAAQRAKESFYNAMNATQASIQPVVRDAHNSQTNSDYAKLESIIRGITPIYTRNGLSLVFSEGKAEKAEHTRVVCDILHRDGHAEQRWIETPNDGKGIKGNVNMTPTHASGSTISYARRYLTCMIFNVALVGEDVDGNTGPEFLDHLQRAWVDAVVKILYATEGFDAWLAWAGEDQAKTLDQIPAKRWPTIVDQLRREAMKPEWKGQRFPKAPGNGKTATTS